MVNTKVFLPKEDQKLPDTYNIKVVYKSGRIKNYEVASHLLSEYSRMYNPTGKYKDANGSQFDLVLSNSPHYMLSLADNLFVEIPFCNVEELEFDKNWSTTVEIRQQLDKKKLASMNADKTNPKLKSV